MIFEEENWMDNEDGKHLEASLFAVPKGLEGLIESSSKKPLGKEKGKRGKARKKSSCKDTFSTMEVQKTAVTMMNTSDKESSSINAKQTQKTTPSTPIAKILTGSQGNAKSAPRKRSLPSETSEESAKCNNEHNTSLAKSRKLDRRNRGLAKLLENDSVQKSISPVIIKEKKRQSKKNKALPGKADERGKRTKIQHDTNAQDDTQDSKSSVLKQAVTTKLKAAQFRFINEQLYTCTSAEASKLFLKNPKSFEAYHSGFTQQLSKWPVNPLDIIIKFIKKRPQSWVVGDFGCGDARLSLSVKNRVHSFDLVAVNERVTVADIAHVPLPDASLDVAVLCLSLMGTNYTEFIREANRTLKMKGTLLIAEVSSRFKNIPKFIHLMKNLGFQMKREDKKDTHFVMFDFIKTKVPNKEFKAALGLLQPCVYKKR